MNKIATQDRTKTSVRLDPDVVDIIATYAKAYTGNDKTKAINELIRAAQEPPSTPQNIQATYQPPIATQLDLRVEKLEQLVSDIQQQLTRLTSKLDDQELTIEDLEPNQHITGQQSKLYNVLLRSEKQEQTYVDDEGRKTNYQWFQGLGLITATDVGRSRSKRIKYRVVGILEPNTQLELTPDGGFIHPNKTWYLVDTTEDDELAIISATHVADTATQEPPSNTLDQPDTTLKLTRDALTDRLAPKHLALSNAKTEKTRANVLKDLPLVLTGMGKSKIAKWTAERDPDGLTWKPTDDAKEHWVTTQP